MKGKEVREREIEREKRERERERKKETGSHHTSTLLQVMFVLGHPR